MGWLYLAMAAYAISAVATAAALHLDRRHRLLTGGSGHPTGWIRRPLVVGLWTPAGLMLVALAAHPVYRLEPWLRPFGVVFAAAAIAAAAAAWWARRGRGSGLAPARISVHRPALLPAEQTWFLLLLSVGFGTGNAGYLLVAAESFVLALLLGARPGSDDRG